MVLSCRLTMISSNYCQCACAREVRTIVCACKIGSQHSANKCIHHTFLFYFHFSEVCFLLFSSLSLLSPIHLPCGGVLPLLLIVFHLHDPSLPPLGDQLAIAKETRRRLGMGTNMHPSSALLGHNKLG